VFGFGKSKRDNVVKLEPIVREVPSAVPTVKRRTPAKYGRIAARNFDAAHADRLTSDWTTQPLTADDVVRRNLRPLVGRSREQASNNDYMKGFLRQCATNIVGPRGVQLQAQSRDAGGGLDKLANDAIEAAWREWGKKQNADVKGRMSWRRMQKQAVTSAARDGEFIYRMIEGAAAGEWGFALQILDPMRLPIDYDRDSYGRGGGNFIRHGIEFNRWGKPVAYHFTTTKPEADADAYLFSGRGFVRIPADEIVHGFVDDLTGQKRGLPWAATALWRLNMLSGFEKAALVNARASAAKGGFFQWREGEGPDEDEDDVDLEMHIEPGMWQELPEGVEAIPNDPTYPTGEFASFSKSMLRGAATGLGVAYNNLANDLEGVNYSSIRQGTLDEREHWKELQEWLIEDLVETVFDRWLQIALLRGKITVNGRPLKAERIDKYRAVSWVPRRWDWIDPNSDVKAAVTAKNNFLTSPSQIIRDRGHDPDTVWREVGRDIEAMRSAGIDDKFIEIALGMKLAAQASPDTEGDGGKPPVE
jgi:lambda family phage portal protein